MTKYANAYTQVYEIIKQLSEEEYAKIPNEVVEVIKENRNTEYKFELDDDLKLKDQELLPETRAILFNIFREYLSTLEQKERIIRIQREERKKGEQRKIEQYHSNLFANKMNNQKLPEENTEIIKYKPNIFKKILNKIRELFHI